jgi:hypothetical protein
MKKYRVKLGYYDGALGDDSNLVIIANVWIEAYNKNYAFKKAVEKVMSINKEIRPADIEYLKAIEIK